ncbi:carboxylating nicotinate-nucleotide diphosphorylase [Corynebacterium sp. 3HC-13]|nr:carboxylating nicotinate-nucleotide diphosphorylase [Corynebacterium poyangense]
MMLKSNYVREVVNRALDEDLEWGPDITTDATVPIGQHGTALVVAREAGVVAGLPVAQVVAEQWALRRKLDPGTITCEHMLDDGQRIQAGETALAISAPIREILSFERVLLNFLSQLSGVATHTRRWVDAVEGTGAQIRDTRKTIPTLRKLQKYAVRCGGGVNHRMGLGDAALVKDNHIAATGSLGLAVERIRSADPDITIQVECDTEDQVQEALDAGVNLLLLDNMSPRQVANCVAAIHQAGAKAEASGGLKLSNARAYAETGVDYLAVGALTHSSTVLDLGLDLG